jgi:transposase
VDHQSRPGVCPKKRARDRLIRLAQRHPAWVVGFADETWWSRLAQPRLHSWIDGDQCLHLVEQTIAPDDPDPKALACYGLLVRATGRRAASTDAVWLRFVAGRPISAITTQFLAWCCAKLASASKTALLLVWDNASWHKSQEVRAWIRSHNRQVKATHAGVRILSCFLPSKSPWLNPIEPKWRHTKRKVVEANALLTRHELTERIETAFGQSHEEPLAIPEKAA